MADPILKWAGAKWNLASWIVSKLPSHTTYLEPYFGSGAVFFTKEPAPFETLNDLSCDVVNLFRVLRESPLELIRAVDLTPWSRTEYEECRSDPLRADGVERARRFLVCCWQQIGVRQSKDHWTGGWRAQKIGHSGPTGTWQRLPYRLASAALRLKDAQIENRPALELLEKYQLRDVCIYADPPYPHSSRGGPLSPGRLQYQHEMSDAEHLELLDALDRHPGPVLLSSYANALYAERLARWSYLTQSTEAQSNSPRTEYLWINPIAWERQQCVLPFPIHEEPRVNWESEAGHG